MQILRKNKSYYTPLGIFNDKTYVIDILTEEITTLNYSMEPVDLSDEELNFDPKKYKILFGKHKGTEIEYIPSQYLNWLSNQENVRQPLRFYLDKLDSYIQKELADAERYKYEKSYRQWANSEEGKETLQKQELERLREKERRGWCGWGHSHYTSNCDACDSTRYEEENNSW